MRAFAMNNWETPPSVTEAPLPQAGPGEVLVRVHAASLNGFDLAVAGGMLRGMLGDTFPLVLGKDFAGTVEALGEGASRFAVGDKVFGVITYPSSLNTRSFAEFVAVPEDSGITHIPEGLKFEHAGALGLAGAAAFQSIEAVAPQSGEVVLISGGTGGVGALAVQFAAASGATVIATARPGEDAEFVRNLGAVHVVDHTGDITAQVREIRPEGIDAIVHLAGDAAQLAALLVPGGRFASTLGIGPDQLARHDVVATSVMANADAVTLDRLAAEVAAGRLRVPIQRTYPLDQVGQAMADFGAGTRGKLAVSIS